MAIELRGSAPLFEVYDMPTSFAFYCGVLGFEVVNTNKEKDADPAQVDWAWLRRNDVLNRMIGLGPTNGGVTSQRGANAKKRSLGLAKNAN